uniref:Uncharacterized protein n=1 Tax=Pristionchus pacificus TaxID=54126 RepID=A0A2A6B8A2_PRIPA|eukprot:PDM62106.1 hypothetical protein PRIPAC_51548 [Pristionchus pacificus]
MVAIALRQCLSPGPVLFMRTVEKAHFVDFLVLKRDGEMQLAKSGLPSHRPDDNLVQELLPLRRLTKRRRGLVFLRKMC